MTDDDDDDDDDDHHHDTVVVDVFGDDAVAVADPVAVAVASPVVDFVFVAADVFAAADRCVC